MSFYIFPHSLIWKTSGYICTEWKTLNNWIVSASSTSFPFYFHFGEEKRTTRASGFYVAFNKSWWVNTIFLWVTFTSQHQSLKQSQPPRWAFGIFLALSWARFLSRYRLFSENRALHYVFPFNSVRLPHRVKQNVDTVMYFLPLEYIVRAVMVAIT